MSAPVSLSEASHEDLFDGLTRWLRTPDKSREMKVETLGQIGLLVKLYESGQLQARGRGTNVEDALARALEEVAALEALDDPDASETRWNAANNAGMR